MREIIMEKLKEIEKKENVRIILAVESGSRGWGFPSKDSDYDVRFIYIRDLKDYLKLNAFDDVLEYPINEKLDINGWDINKALSLFHKSNPTIMEWLNSKIIYIDSEEAQGLREIMNNYFSIKRGMCHYISMAKTNYKEYLRRDVVPLKKYFYVLRPILAAKWIYEKRTPPPMEFKELVNGELIDDLKEIVKHLLDLKMNHSEIKEIERIDELNSFFENEMVVINEQIDSLPKEDELGWEELNDMFLSFFKLND